MKNLAREGVDQGDMSPTVENYQRPEDSYAMADKKSKTLDYIGRQDSIQEHEADKLRKQNYVGRYE